MSVPLPEQRVRRWQTYLVVWRLHRWAALTFAALIVLLSVTGGLLVIHHDLERWLHPERHVVAAPTTPTPRAALVPILRQLQTEAPAGFRPLIVFVGPDRSTRWSAFINPHTGEILWRGPDQSLLTPWLLHLHMHLQIGKWGYVLTGVAGLALTFLGLTGLWITRDRLTALFRHPFRKRLGPRVAFADLHKWIGMATLYFTLVLGATGVWFAILIVPNQLQPEARKPLAPPFNLDELAPIEPAIATARAHFPGSELARVILPWDAGINLQVRVLHRDAPVWEKFSRIDFDPVTGQQLKVVDARAASTAAKWQAILGPLHFGYYGSPLVKWLYVIGGFAPALLAITGTTIWILRRRKRPTRSAQPAALATASVR
jgi:uncharacterized iron-regulated membrane protein